MQTATAPGRRPRIIVLGNEKGGTGKSTLAMHLAVALLNRGLRVATIDLDADQGTLSHYIANRRRYGTRTGSPLPMPTHVALGSQPMQIDAAEVARTLEYVADHDVVVMDTPGYFTSLSQAGHFTADVLVTPINDSFVDLDVLSRLDSNGAVLAQATPYTRRVWDAQEMRARRPGRPLDWIVVRNRVGSLAARNKRAMGDALDNLSKKVGFRIADGIHERVIYRELFLDGLTVEDLLSLPHGRTVSMSHVAARQEMRNLLSALDLALVQAA
jgi:chromosome partitioning protein